MDRTERFYRIEMLIRSRAGGGCVSFAELMDELGVSRATLKRDLEYLRERMNAPIVYDRFANGYRFATPAEGARASAAARAAHELPGLWFSEGEIHALLTMHQLIRGLDEGGVLARHLQPLLERLHGMLGRSDGESRELMKRVKIASPARRPVAARHFEVIGSALTRRQRVHMRYRTRSRQEVTERVVSPQRLVHYRNTWYLDAWCHLTEKLRRFALDAVLEARLVEQRARDVGLRTVEAELDAGYGIFAASAKGKLQWATLRFTAEAAQWVAHEQWHPAQQATLERDGTLTLQLPYASDTELVMDVLRHGEHVRVIQPERLAALVAQRLQEAARQYPGAG